MHAPVRALLWQIAWRYRWGHFIAAAYLLAAVVLCHVLPPDLGIFAGSSSIGDDGIPAAGWLLGFPTFWVMIYVMAVFSLAGRTAGDSGFTARMFVLPVRTGTMVGWLMAGGCIAVTAVWIAAARLVFRPGGVDVPLWWPAATAAVLLAWFQVLVWTPFSQRWLQMALTVFALTTTFLVLGFVLSVAEELAAGDLLIALVMLSLVAPAYLAAVVGVARARRGDTYDWRLWERFLEWLAARRRPAERPFASAQRAQLWFECRAHGWLLPVLAGSLQICFFCVLLIEPGDVALSWQLVGRLLVAPLFIATVAGCALGNVHDPFSKSANGAFVLLRPVSTVLLVRAKIVAAAIGAVATWLLLLTILPFLFLRPGFFASVREVVQSVPVWKAVLLFPSAIVLLVALTWKSMIENLWINLTGRPWVAHAVTAGFVVLMCFGGVAGSWIYFHPQFHPTAWAAVPWMIGSLLLCKLIVAATVLRSLDRHRLIGRQSAAALVGVWSLVVIALYLIACWLTPNRPWSDSGALVATVLAVPFSRLIGALLALEWNRGR